MVLLFTKKTHYARIVEIKIDSMLREKRWPMNKNEFLDSLRRNLSGEVPIEEVQSNIRFYSEYISSDSEEEESRKINEVGDPRLIAMNIIETYKMSHKVPHGNGRAPYEESYEETYGNGGNTNMKKGQSRIDSIKLKVMGAASIILVVVFIMLLIRAVSFALRLFLPVLIVFFLVFFFAGILRRR